MKTFFVSLVALLASLVLVPVPKVLAVDTPWLGGKYVGGDAVTLWWSQSPGATYQVVYGPVDNPTAHGVTLGEGTDYTVRQLFRNTSYVFTVKALQGNQVSGYSNPVIVHVGGYGRPPVTTYDAPAPIQYVTAQPVQQVVYVAPVPAVAAPSLGGAYAGADVASLWWTQVPGASYQVTYGPKDNPYAHTVMLGEGNNYQVRALFRNTSFVFSVRAYQNGMWSGYSNWVRVWIGHYGRPPLGSSPMGALLYSNP